MVPFSHLTVLIGWTVVFVTTNQAAPLQRVSEPYYVSEYNLTFLQSWTECKFLGMNLVRLESESAYKNLTAYLQGGGYSENNSYWLGGVKTTTGAWMWLDTQEHLTFSKWAANEPKTTKNTDYCLQMGRDYGNTDAVEWQAQSCSNNRYFICENSNF